MKWSAAYVIGATNTLHTKCELQFFSQEQFYEQNTIKGLSEPGGQWVRDPLSSSFWQIS